MELQEKLLEVFSQYEQKNPLILDAEFHKKFGEEYLRRNGYGTSNEYINYKILRSILQKIEISNDIFEYIKNIVHNNEGNYKYWHCKQTMLLQKKLSLNYDLFDIITKIYLDNNIKSFKIYDNWDYSTEKEKFFLWSDYGQAGAFFDRNQIEFVNGKIEIKK